MIVHPHVLQGSEEWFRMRIGRATASNASRIITPKTGEYAKASKGYMAELIAECFLPDIPDFIGNDNTERGNNQEQEAREAFEAHTGYKVEQVGFVTMDDEFAGCSPDGMILGLNNQYIAGVEIKNPGTAMKVSSPMCGYEVSDLSAKKHVEWIMDGILPDEHKAQVHFSMAVTGLPEWHFWSYFKGLQPFHVVTRADDFTGKLKECLKRFTVEYGAARAAIIPKLKLTPNKQK